MPIEERTLRVVRSWLLGLVVIGTCGFSVELLLIGHHEDANQLIPLVTAGLAVATIVWVLAAPGVAALRALQFVMLLYIAAAIVGVTLHFQANAEFQREMDPAISGLALFWHVVQATAPPALAPGVMAQLGLLGLVYTYKHPGLRGEDIDGTAAGGSGPSLTSAGDGRSRPSAVGEQSSPKTES